MNIQKRSSLFALITLLTLIFNLMFPTSALADDNTPPPAPTEIVTQTAETPATSEATAPSTETPTPAPTEAPPTDLQLDSASVILEQVPADTNVIVLDESGAALPLVTQEAEQVILTSDPMWCPDGIAPGGVGCSPTQASMTDLLTWLTSNNPNQAGTIWIEDSYDSSTNAGDAAVTTGFTLDGTTLTNMANHSLTIQGGWNGTNGSTIITGTSTFNGDFLSIINWDAGVTINSIIVNDSASTGITVQTTGDITLDNVTASGNNNDNNGDEHGAVLDNSSGTGDISVSNSTFNDNLADTNFFDGGIGLDAYSNGDISLDNVTANGNDFENAYLDNCIDPDFDDICAGTGAISVSNSTFNNSVNDDGIQTESNNHTTLYNVIANGNYDEGIEIDVYGPGDIILNYVTANGNDVGEGAELDNDFIGSTGNVFISNSSFNNTLDDQGISADSNGNITLDNVTANGNSDDGADLGNDFSGVTGTISISNSTFNNNGDNGIDAHSNVSITLNNVAANGNYYDGVHLGLNDSGDVSITNSTFNNNAAGLFIHDVNNVFISNSTFDANTGNGADVEANGFITIKCSLFTNNSGYGIDADATNLNLLNNIFSNNTLGDYFVNTGTVTLSDNCNPSNNNKPRTTGGGLSLQIVNGNSAELDCDLYSGTVLILPNGDKVTFKCPIGGSATLNAVTNDALPQALPDGLNYVSGMVAVQSPDGMDVALDGLVVVDFIIPEDLKGSNFAILYWNGTEWIDLADIEKAQGTKDAKFNDGRKVFNAGYVTEDGYFEALTNFSGNFVLVTK